MKKSILYLLMFVLTIGLTTSCSSDDDSSGGSESGIVGKWNLTQAGGYDENGTLFFVDVFQLCPGKNYLEVEFFADGTFHSEMYEYECEHDSSSGTYTVNGNILTGIAFGDEGGEAEPLTIEELTSTKLKLKGTDDEDGDFYLVFTRM